jgi:hypothetical protein
MKYLENLYLQSTPNHINETIIIVNLPKSWNAVNDMLVFLDNESSKRNLEEIVLQVIDCFNHDLANLGIEILMLPDLTFFPRSIKEASVLILNDFYAAIRLFAFDLFIEINNLGLINNEHDLVMLNIRNDSVTLLITPNSRFYGT